jgi:hypothetical protein
VSRLSTCLLLLSPVAFLAGALTSNSTPDPTYEKDIYPLIAKYCGGCHSGESAPGGIPLRSFKTAAFLTSHRSDWERVVKNLNNRHMPPVGSPAPTDAERQTILEFLSTALGARTTNPGRVTLRRLNRAEYNNTIRDLFGVDLHPADDFPSDDVGYGFDNIGDVLSMSPLLMEKYMKAAQRVAGTVIYTPGERHIKIPGAEGEAENSNPTGDGGRMFYSNGGIKKQIHLPAAGKYRLTVSAYQTKGGPDDAKMSISIAGQTVQTVDVTATASHPQSFKVEFDAAYGATTVGAAFINDYYVPKSADNAGADRNLAINYLLIDGPIGTAVKLPASHSRIIFEQPTPQTRVDCERKILGTLANRAYRRPATKNEVDKLVSIAELAHKNGDSFEQGIQLGVVAVLCSPNFLFRAEKPTGDVLGPYELATRLSYFLWSSTPDDELLAKAASGQLSKPDVLQAQVERMLADPKASALAENFAGQWLQTRKLVNVAPDRKQFPDFNDAMRRDMASETMLFFRSVVQGDRSVLDFIDGSYGFLNEPLARMYGIDGIQGRNFRRVEMPPERAGIITQASVLTVTSNPTRTSPVKRGKWILENILGTPPPDPPPNVGVLKDDKASVEAATMRERLAQHRKDPACANCHLQMDGLGFALENFDAIGKWRTKDGPFDIDAKGTLPDGSSFNGPTELRVILMKRKDQFVRCLAEKLLTYSIGRGMEPYDDPAIDKIVKATTEGQYKFSKLVIAIIESDPFRKNRAER